MKIKKLTEQKLQEDDKVNASDITFDDVDSKSVGEVTADLNNAVMAATGGKKGIDIGDGIEVAQDLKNAAVTLNTDQGAILPPKDAPLNVRNALTDKLDRCLAVARRNMTDREPFGANLLVTGLPGSGKTAIVNEWCKSRKLNLVYINAKNPDLDAYINGYPVQIEVEYDGTVDKEGNKNISAISSKKLKKVVDQAYSQALAELHKEDSILFLDEYNRQTKPQIRASLLTLINEKTDARGKDGEGDFSDSLLFTVACINPAVGYTDEGAVQLNGAELSRFVAKIRFDSNVPTTRDYFTRYFNRKIDEALSILQDNPNNAEAKARLERYLREQYLGLFIINDFDFVYDDENCLDQLFNNQLTQLNQRSFTEGLNFSAGKKTEFRDWYQNDADFRPEVIEMFDKILARYTEPSFEDLLSQHKINLNLSVNKTEPTITSAPEQTASEPDDDRPDLEDDTDLFANANTGASIKTVSATEVGQIVADAIANISF